MAKMNPMAAAAEERSNPFEAIWSRRKFNVLGEKRKGEERHPKEGKHAAQRVRGERQVVSVPRPAYRREGRERLKEQQKRMLGIADSSDEDDDDEDDNHMKRGNSKPISSDDLGDSFTLDESTQKKKGWADEIYEREGREIGDDAAGSDDGESDNEPASDDEADDDDQYHDEEGDEEDSSDNDFGNISARDWEQSDDDEVDLREDEGSWREGTRDKWQSD